jgi:hypothetical protein
MSLLNHYRISLASTESLTPFPPARKQAQQTIPKGNSVETKILKIDAYTPIFEIDEYSSISQKQVVHITAESHHLRRG